MYTVQPAQYTGHQLTRYTQIKLETFANTDIRVRWKIQKFQFRYMKCFNIKGSVLELVH